jgi:hypothetical protein
MSIAALFINLVYHHFNYTSVLRAFPLVPQIVIYIAK